jgi:exodeoxyribonuclease V alpha subunit
MGMPSSPVPQSAPQSQQPQVAVLDGVLERVTFCNPETGYTIARLAPDRGTGRGPVSAATELVTVVGPLLGAQVGESLRLRGRWSSHVKYGRQFDVHSYTTVLPATEQGIRRYLGSGLIRGIGPVMAERMVAHFGVDIMHVIDDEPQRLVEVPGLGPKRSARISGAWAEQKAIKEVMIFLQGCGVSTSLAVKIYKKYGDESIGTVKQQPYRLAADIWGIGRHRQGQPRADQGRPRPHPVRGRRRRPLLPPRAPARHRGRQDPGRARRPDHAAHRGAARRRARRPRGDPRPRG